MSISVNRFLPVLVLVSLWPLSFGCSSSTQMTSGVAKAQPLQERRSTATELVGTGCVTSTGDAAEDRMAADEAARAEVAKQIEIKVIQQMESIQRELSNGDSAQLYSSVSVTTREMVDTTLKGVQIVDRYSVSGDGTTCSVAVLDKAVLARRIRQELERFAGDASSFLAAAGKADQEGRYTQAIRGYGSALACLGPAAVQEGLLQDLGFSSYPIPSRAETWKKLLRVLESVRLYPASGNLQKARPGRPLENPLIVRAQQDSGAPIAELPLKVLRAPTDIKMQREVRTDAAGMATFMVFDVPRGKQPLQEIAVGLNWPALMQGAGESEAAQDIWQGWDNRETVFSYSLPVPGDYRVAVAVYNSATGRAMAGSSVQAALLNGFQRAGFQTQDIFALPGAIRQSFSQKPSLQNAKRLLQGRADILVIGDYRMGEPRKSYDFIFCRAQLVAQGIVLDTGRTLVTLDVSAKGGGLDNARAARKAEENLAEKAAAEAGGRLAGAVE